jgi:predicted ATPase
MLRSIQLENFKAFGRRTIIPLAPITLIFGENSAGKSSILHSLNLLKQTRESRDVEAILLPRTENGILDLGSFQELVFDHDLSRSLSIRLDVANLRRGSFGLRDDDRTRGTNPNGLEFSFSRKTLGDEITLDGFKLCGESLTGSIAEFERTQMPKRLQRSVSFQFQSGRRRQSGSLGAAKCVRIHPETDFWRPRFERTKDHQPLLLSLLGEAKQGLDSRNPAKLEDFEFAYEPEGYWSRVRSVLEDAERFFSTDFSYDDYVQEMTRNQSELYVAIDGFVPVSAGQNTDQPNLESVLARMPIELVRRAGWRIRRSELLPDLGFTSVTAGRAVQETLASLFPLGPFRKPPSRWYIFTGTTPKDVGYQGHLLPDLLLRQRELLANTNAWLCRLDVGHELRTLALGPSDLFELRLVDTRRQPAVEVGLSDVGFGISQILPLIVQSLAASDQIITIEQPEVHIHPRLQADLGDLLIEATKEPRRNQFIIETHSEHLALRLQRRVREGLDPANVSIIYVSRGPEGAVVKPLELDDQGDFAQDFPGGFFPERLGELR